MKSPRCIIIAGPNGAGKTTFAREYLPKGVGVVNFVNADLLAAADVLRRFNVVGRILKIVYKPPADSWAVYDNSGDRLQLIAASR